MGRVLSEAQLARYEDDGILFPVPALEPGPLAEFRAGFDAVTAEIGEDRRPQRFGQWHLCFRWAYDLATHPAILDAVEDLLGPDLLVHSTTAFAKRRAVRSSSPGTRTAITGGSTSPGWPRPGSP